MHNRWNRFEFSSLVQTHQVKYIGKGTGHLWWHLGWPLIMELSWPAKSRISENAIIEKACGAANHDKHRWVLKHLLKVLHAEDRHINLLSRRWLIVWVTSTRSMCWGFWYKRSCIQLQSGQPQSILAQSFAKRSCVGIRIQYYVAMAHSLVPGLQIAIWRPENSSSWYQSQQPNAPQGRRQCIRRFERPQPRCKCGR